MTDRVGLQYIGTVSMLPECCLAHSYHSGQRSVSGQHLRSCALNVQPIQPHLPQALDLQNCSDSKEESAMPVVLTRIIGERDFAVSLAHAVETVVA